MVSFFMYVMNSDRCVIACVQGLGFLRFSRLSLFLTMKTFIRIVKAGKNDRITQICPKVEEV